MEGVGVGCGVVCDEFNVLPGKKFRHSDRSGRFLISENERVLLCRIGGG